jgi:hypothetical protein
MEPCVLRQNSQQCCEYLVRQKGSLEGRWACSSVQITDDGVEHKTFSVKADYIRKIDYAAPTEASESNAVKPAKKKAK